MVALSRILFVVDRSERAHAALSKALLVARYFHASVRIFLCETAAYGTDGAADRATERSPGVAPAARAQDYVEALARTISSGDVAVSAAAAHCVSLAQAILAESRTYRADLIVVAAPIRTSIQLKPAVAIWQQALESDVSVLITHGHPWSPTPQFAALVQSTEADDRNLTAAIAQMSTALSDRCHGELHILLATEAAGPHSETADWRRWWTALTHGHPATLVSCRTLSGDLAAALSRIPGEPEYDLLIMGKPEPPADAKPGLVATILGSSGPDVLLVASRSPI
jgi:nucleotide-binding universal stress UspA family protein